MIFARLAVAPDLLSACSLNFGTSSQLRGLGAQRLRSGYGTLIVAESYATRLTAYDIGADGALGSRRVWAETPGDHPDGICLDAEGAVWYADVGNQHCVRAREGGEVLATVDLDRGAFACALSRGQDPRLFVVGQHYGGPETAQPSGRVIAFPAPAPGAGKP
jgi:sugar lactone lactonase YvrE